MILRAAAIPLASGPWLRALLPGLALAVAVAAAARVLSTAVPAAGEVLIAIVLGIAVANLVQVPASVRPGVAFALQRLLRAGIVLLGARLSLGAVLEIGASALGLILLGMALAFTVAIVVGRSLRLPRRLAWLIGVGTAVCGNSAIVATAPSIKAEAREVAFAVATITLFGTLAVIAFPLVGHALALPDAVYGVWAGIAVNDTSQVVAAGAAYSPLARDVATVVKLVRNAMMAPLILLIAWWWQREAQSQATSARRAVARAVPLFVLGFLALAALRSLGLLPAALLGPIDEAARALILVALAAVGLNTRIAEMRSIGATPFLAGLVTASALAAVGLAAVLALDVAPVPR